MTYATEFPNMGDDTACAAMSAPSRASGWEDTSWANDVCPSFTCDVFVLWCDHEQVEQRESPNGPRFCLTCEDHTYLETDDWSDVLAFMDDGKRDFAEYQYRDA